MLDLSRNEAFRHCPPDIFNRAVRAVCRDAHKYTGAKRLATEAAIAHFLKIEPCNVLLTRGVDDAVDLFVYLFGQRRLFTMTPGFDGFDARIAVAGGMKTDVFWPIQSLAPPVLDSVTMDAALLVASPGNPCGRIFPEMCLAELTERRVQVFLDHTYFDFSSDALTGQETYATLFKRLWQNEVFHYLSFSKAWALAGLRLGAIISSDSQAIRAMRQAQIYDAIDTFALHVLDGALADAYPLRIAADAAQARDWLALTLVDAGHAVVTRQGNFVIVPDEDAKLTTGLATEDISVKVLTGIMKGWIRISAPPLNARARIRRVLKIAR